MANFFKDYQKTIREKREEEKKAEMAAKAKAKEYAEYFSCLNKGAKVKVNPAYAECGYMYFADQINDNSVLLSDDKESAKHGYGYIYAESVVIR